MDQGEFYSPKEYNTTEEYKHFPAEIYWRPNEENKGAAEVADPGREITPRQEKKRTSKKRGGGQTLMEKIFHSIRGAATAATVAAASVVVTATFVTGAPDAHLIDLVCEDTYVEYQMEVRGLEEGGEYALVVSATNEEDRELELEGDGVYGARVEGLRPDWEYTLALVQYDSLLGEIRHFEQSFQTRKGAEQQPQPPPAAPIPEVTLTHAVPVGLDRVQIFMTCQDLPQNAEVTLGVAWDDAPAKSIALTGADIARGYVTVSAEGLGALTVTPTVTVGEVHRTGKTYAYALENALSVKVVADLRSGACLFYPAAIVGDAEYVSITSSEAPEASEPMWLEDMIFLEYGTAGEITYTMYLTNEAGDVLSDRVSVTVNTAVTVPEAQYQFFGTNPNQVGVTYNDDGTINVYIDTGFESEQAELYYQVTLGGMRYTSRDRYARIECIPDQSYALRYDVCLDIDGVTYSVANIVPSGVVNESSSFLSASLEGNVLDMIFYQDTAELDLDTVVVIGEGGETHRLTESEIVWDEEIGNYRAALTLDAAAEHVTVQVMGNPYHSGLEGVIDPLGNAKKLLEETVYQP